MRTDPVDAKTPIRRRPIAREPVRCTSAPAMALIRLNGTLDAAMRDALTVWQLVALADRIGSGAETAADRALMGAFSASDMNAAHTAPAAFIKRRAEPLRPVVAVMRAAISPCGAADAITAAAAAVHVVTAILADRLRVLADCDELARIGELFERGHVAAEDLAVIRATPGHYLCAHASARHFAIFADYRLRDD